MTQFQPGTMNYVQSFGSSPNSVAFPHLDVRAPATTDILYPVGKRWVDTVAGNEYALTNYTVSNGVQSAHWAFLGSSSGDLDTLTADDMNIVAPTSGNINVAGVSPLSTTGSGSTLSVNLSGTVGVAHGGTGAVTLTGVLTGNGTSAITGNAVTNHGVLLGGASNAVSSLGVASTGTILAGATGADPAFTASPSVTGSVTAGTTVTATLGDITASNGNFVSSTAGKGLSFAANTNTGAASGPVVLNSRAGQVIFTSVSIAAAADLTLTITNSAVTASTTQIIYSMSGATTGSALSIKSVTNSSGSSAIVVTNGTGATTTTADITLNFIVVN